MLVLKGSNTDTINKIFSKNKNVEFVKGAIYKITKTVYIHSNMVIDLNGATLRRYCSKPVLMTERSSTVTKYNGVHDVIIKNGTIEAMNSLGYSVSNLTALFHAKNITFENVTFLDACGSHCIDIVACNNVTIKNCKFLGYKSNGNDHKESIQIDFAYYGGLPYYTKTAKTYDLTKCKNITIDGCTFGKSSSYPAQYVAIGTHQQANNTTYHTGIKITNNKAVGNGVSSGYGFFVRLMNMKNVTISGNTVKNYGRFVLVSVPTVLRNSDSSAVTATMNKSTVRTVENIVINNNNILSNGYKYQAYAVYIKDTFGVGRNISVTNLKGVPSDAVYIKYCKNVNINF